MEEPLRAQDMRLPAFDIFGRTNREPLADTLVPPHMRVPDEQLTPRSRLTKRAWQRLDQVLANQGVLVDVLRDQQLVERGERPAWFARVCRAHSRMREILRCEDYEAKVRRIRREAARPPPHPTT